MLQKCWLALKKTAGTHPELEAFLAVDDHESPYYRSNHIGMHIFTAEKQISSSFFKQCLIIFLERPMTNEINFIYNVNQRSYAFTFELQQNVRWREKYGVTGKWVSPQYLMLTKENRTKPFSEIGITASWDQKLGVWTAEIYGDLDSRSNCVSPPGTRWCLLNFLYPVDWTRDNNCCWLDV